jgi:hypothetical protein
MALFVGGLFRVDSEACLQELKGYLISEVLLSQHVCGLVVRVQGYRSVYRWFDSLLYQMFMKSSGLGLGSTQPREDNCGYN